MDKTTQFQPENQFWRNRSKHGRDRLFESADALQEAAEEYFDWCDRNPLWTVEFNGKDAVECKVPVMRAYTLSGLCVYLRCNENYFNQFKTSKTITPDFSWVIAHIEGVIRTQKFEGAAGGLLNANIISRDLGLIDKQQLATTARHHVRRDEESGDIVIESN